MEEKKKKIDGRKAAFERRRRKGYEAYLKRKHKEMAEREREEKKRKEKERKKKEKERLKRLKEKKKRPVGRPKKRGPKKKRKKKILIKLFRVEMVFRINLLDVIEILKRRMMCLMH